MIRIILVTIIVFLYKMLLDRTALKLNIGK
jgi:hypothetical protein